MTEWLNSIKLLMMILIHPIDTAKGKYHRYKIDVMEYILFIVGVIHGFRYIINSNRFNIAYIILVPLSSVVVCKYLIPLMIGIERIIINSFISITISKEIFYKMVLPYYVVRLTLNTIIFLDKESKAKLYVSLIIMIWSLFQRYLLVRFRVGRTNVKVKKLIKAIVIVVLIHVLLIFINNYTDRSREVNNRNIIREEIYGINKEIYDMAVNLFEHDISIDYDTYTENRNLLQSRIVVGSAAVYYDVKEMTIVEMDFEENVQELLEISYNISKKDKNKTEVLTREYFEVKAVIDELVEKYYQTEND